MYKDEINPAINLKGDEGLIQLKLSRHYETFNPLPFDAIAINLKSEGRLVESVIINTDKGMLINNESLYKEIPKFKYMYFILTTDSLSIGLDGVGFAQILHKTPLTSPLKGGLSLTFDAKYSHGYRVSNMKAIERATEWQRKQVEMYSSMKGSLDLSYYDEEYTNGDECAVNGRARKIKVIYFCDHWEDNKEFSVQELMEPDWCVYEVKVLSKHFCGPRREIMTEKHIKGSKIEDRAIRCLVS